MIPCLVSASVVLLFDQACKRLVRARLLEEFISVGPIVRITRVNNTDAGYRRLTGRAALVAIWISAVVSAIVLYSFAGWFQRSGAQLGLGLAIGGAAGNLVDIVQYGYVIDFIELRWCGVFNLADVAIVSGLIAAFSLA
jgi:signal peptidase II